jgi:hypothetical protein
MAHTVNSDFEHVYVISVADCYSYFLLTIYTKCAYYES